MSSENIHVATQLEEIMCLHADNPKIWDHWVEKTISNFYDREYLTRIFDRNRAYNEEPCYFYSVDGKNRLQSCIPGFVNWDENILNLGIGITVGEIFWAPNVKIKKQLPGYAEKIKAIAQENQLIPIFQNVYGKTKDMLVQFFPSASIEVFPGLFEHFIPLADYENVAEFLEFMAENPESQFGRKDWKKLLEGNLPVEIYEDFLKKGHKGFPNSDNPQLMEVANQKAKILSRRKQARHILQTQRNAWNGFENLKPQERNRRLDQKSEELLKAGQLHDLQYRIEAISEERIDQIWPLFENQARRFGEKVPFLTKDNLNAFTQFETGENFLQMVYRGADPIGFFLIYLSRGLFHSLACGFDHGFSLAHSLYFNLTVQAFVEAKKRGAKQVDVGNGDEPLSEQKVRFGAKAIETVGIAWTQL